MHTPSEQNAALDELRRLVLRANPDLKDKPVFWKRKASVLKVWGSVGSERVWGEVGGRGRGERTTSRFWERRVLLLEVWVVWLARGWAKRWGSAGCVFAAATLMGPSLTSSLA